MSVTIEHIAKRAKVSTATVSRVLNGLAVKHDTEKRVKGVMEAMQYRPNRFARGLAAQRTGFLGVVTHSLGDPYVAAVLSGIEKEARAHDKLVTLNVFDNLDPNEKNDIQAFLSPSLVEGAIFLLPPPALEDVLKGLAHKRFPFVVASERRYEDIASSVVIDNFNGARQATEYLLGKGHRRIGFIAGHPDLTDSEDRLAGYREALKSAGILPEEGLVFPGDYQIPSGWEAAEKFLDMPDPPTAVFASNDFMAVGVLKALHGLKREGAFAVMGFDDIPLASLVQPSLSTVGFDLCDLGKLAVSKLLRIITGEETNRSTVQLKGRLVTRESA